MDTVNSLMQSPWLAAAGTIASLLGLLLTIISTLNYIQRRSLNVEHRTGEDSYLQGIIEYIHHLNVHASFDEQFFIEREYKLKDKYQARSFFMAKHQAMPQMRRIFSGVTGQPAKKSEGYFTRDLFREATVRNDPLIVLGEPGSGKSVTARQLATSIAAASLKRRRPNRLLPVFITLSEYIGTDAANQPNDFYTFLVSSLQRRGTGAGFPSQYLVDHLDYYLDSGRLFFILDSLDEMPPASFTLRCQAISDFMVQHSTNCFVITCRSNDFGANLHGREAFLDKLAPKEIKEFIRKRRSLLQHWNVSDICKRIVASDFVLSSVVDNPFYLNLILFFVSIKGILPENFPLLFRVVCADWAEREIKKAALRGSRSTRQQASAEDIAKSAVDLRVALYHIAFAISSSSGFGTAASRSQIEKASASFGITVDRIRTAIQLAASGGMLEVSLDQSHLRFVHHKFQEYFAAEFLNLALKREWVQYEDLPAICGNIWWEEVTALLTSITDHPEQIIETLLQDTDTQLDDDSTTTTLRRNFWLVGRALRSLPNDADSKPRLVSRVIAIISNRVSESRLPELLDCLKGLGEIDDEGSVRILAGYLKSRSKILRELAFSQLANFSLGQRFLAEHVHRIGFSIYVRNEYGGYGGRHARQVRNIAFLSRHSRIVMMGYAFLGAAIRHYLVLYTITVLAFALNKYLMSVYCVMLIGARLGVDAARLYLDRRVPGLKVILLHLVIRTVFLLLLAVALARGFFDPPFWSAFSVAALWVIPQAVVFGVLLGPAAIRKGLKKLLVRVMNPRTLEGSSERADLMAVKLGYIHPDTYVHSRVSSLRDLKRFLDKLEESDFGGVEMELYEALQNAERRFLQKESTPNILTAVEYLKREEKEIE